MKKSISENPPRMAVIPWSFEVLRMIPLYAEFLIFFYLKKCFHLTLERFQGERVASVERWPILLSENLRVAVD